MSCTNTVQGQRAPCSRASILTGITAHKDRQVFHAAITEFQGQRRHGSAHTTHRSKEEETLRLRFQELQRRNAVLMGEERKLRERVQHLEKVNAILRQCV